MPALIAIGTDLVLRRSGDSRTIPLEDFFLDYQKQDLQPGEFVERFFVAKPRDGQVFHTHKISKRFDQDISAVCGAIGFTLDKGVVRNPRLCFGGMAATPKRAAAAEAVLAGKPWDRKTVESAAAVLKNDFSPISDMRSSASYRLRAAENFLVKALLETSGKTRETDVLVADEAYHA